MSPNDFYSLTIKEWKTAQKGALIHIQNQHLLAGIRADINNSLRPFVASPPEMKRESDFLPWLAKKSMKKERARALSARLLAKFSGMRNVRFKKKDS